MRYLNEQEVNDLVKSIKKEQGGPVRRKLSKLRGEVASFFGKLRRQAQVKQEVTLNNEEVDDLLKVIEAAHFNEAEQGPASRELTPDGREM